MTKLGRIAGRVESLVRRAIGELRDRLRSSKKKAPPLGRARPLGPPTAAPGRSTTDLRIAVQVHVFYPDLAAELLDAATNVPGRPQILASAVTSEGVEAVKAWSRKTGFDRDRVQVRLAPNRGRNVSAFTTTFGRELLERFDLFCHLHTKKSLYTGSEQRGWRQHNVERLIGGRKHASYVVDLFLDHPEIGLVAPRPFPEIPYWAFTWLSNRSSGERAMEKLGFATSWHGYVDYPLGCMFWARPNAIRQLLDGRFTYDDFPAESGQTDGTLAHAIERVPAMLTRANGYHWTEVGSGRDAAWLDWGEKNLWQYRDRASYAALIAAIDRAKTISFDVFDTLLTRITPDPDDVFRLVEKELDASAGRATRFMALRKEAERRARRKSARDPDCARIYGEISKSELSATLVEEAQRIELDVESAVLRPRARVMDAYRHAVRAGKRVILTSDFYLGRAKLESLLEEKGVRGHQAIYLSCDVGLRKDTGALWEHLIEKEGANTDRFLHVGDNEHSDVQLPINRGIPTFHVLSPRNIFALGPLAGNAVPASLGPVIATLYNDPFEGR